MLINTFVILLCVTSALFVSGKLCDAAEEFDSFSDLNENYKSNLKEKRVWYSFVSLFQYLLPFVVVSGHRRRT